MSLPHHDVAIVGSGFAGIGMAIALGREGIEQQPRVTIFAACPDSVCARTPPANPEQRGRPL
jgi:cation diffusion facilitator CzcD-associated flavoprotein CzcO